jgi:hypothetical protein
MASSNEVKKRYFVEKTSAIVARPHDIFQVLLDFKRWNQWTQSITQMSVLDNEGPKPGVRIKVLQPKLSPAVWTITEIVPDTRLIWEKKSFGLRMVSEHLITLHGDEASVTIRMTYNGPLAGLAFNLTQSLTDRYLTLEINGLKRECERVTTAIGQ